MVMYVTGCYRPASQRKECKDLLIDDALIDLQDRIHLRLLVKSEYQNIFFLFLDETYVVGIQKEQSL